MTTLTIGDESRTRDVIQTSVSQRADHADEPHWSWD